MSNTSSRKTEQENTSLETRATAEEVSGSQDRMTHSEIEDSRRSDSAYTEHEEDETSEGGKAPSPDLGERYIARTQEAMQKWNSKPRDGFHITDVVLCKRLVVFRKVDPRPIDAKTVSIYVIGKSSHEAYQSLYRSDKRTFEIEKYVEYRDIQGSVDIYDRRNNIPLEFKTTRASDIKEPKFWHSEQLRYYMGLLGAKQGILIYQLLMHFGETPFRAFKISMNAKERKHQRDKLVREVDSLKRATEAGSPALVSSVRKNPALNWMCSDCPYAGKCEQMEQMQDAAAAA
jgi:hypothetical protein